ncbi:MAG TPA: R3H domain-containing nucleic acid-binding protein [Candidatus Limnocylindrales bacterium]
MTDQGPLPRRELIDDLDLLLGAIPPDVVEAVHALTDPAQLIEVVMDLGRRPEARFTNGEVTLLEREITEADIAYVVDHIGTFGDDNRAGIERTLHRISAIRNRTGKIVGLTCRIGRAVYGTIEIINDFVESGKSILIMGRPGIGKTTMLREAARVLADDQGKRVVVVDTSNEIAGDGDIPHPAIGRARRMQVKTPSVQHEVMIEAVENHMPEIIVIDEIGTELEAQAARTIAERGVQLIGTAHGNNLDNLMLNPTLTDLIGGIQTVTLGDEEARRRRSQKSVLERKAPPTFDVIVEILDRERVTVHADVADTVDALLRGDPISSELRWRDEGGVHRSQSRPKPSPREALSGGDRFGSDRFAGLVGAGPGWRTEPGWRGGASHGAGDWREAERTGLRPGYRSGTSGGWRAPVRGPRGVHDAPRRPRSDSGGGAGSGGGAVGGPGGAAGWPGGAVGGPGGSGGAGLESAARNARPPASEAAARTLPGERFATSPFGPERGGDAPFRAGDIADRGPIERGAPPVPEPRPRELRELERQRSWREQATRALNTYRAEEVTEEDEEEITAQAAPQSIDEALDADDEAIADRVREQAGDDGFDDEDGGRPVLRVRDGGTVLPTLRVFPHGISRKRLEQGVKELQLPVIIARDPDEADVVMTLKSEYRQKTTALRDAEERGLPIYVLKSNTVVQMEASLTSIFSLEVDPREAALRETEEAIGLVFRNIEPVELSPQNAYIRRLQHQMAERANLVSRSRGREPYRRVRLYP